MGILEVQLLGGFRLAYDGEPVGGLDSPRSQALLAFLLLNRETPQPRQQIAYLFWPDSSEAQARTNLRQQIHRLRQSWPAADRYLLIDGTRLQWRPEAQATLDVAAFEKALSQADQALQARHDEEAIDELKAAVACHSGELLPGCYDEWILPKREQLRQRYAGALEQLTALLAGRGAHDQAIAYTRELVALDDLQETYYRQLMQLHAATGNRAAALRVYHHCVTVLERELGVAPGRETQQMYERVRAAQEYEALAAGRARPAGQPAEIHGRVQEWATLQAAWREAAGGRAQAIWLTGEAGIGKTHLAEHLLQWASRQGIAAAAARCYPGEGDMAYAPLVAWLRSDVLRRVVSSLPSIWLAEIARILPEVALDRPDVAPVPPLAESWQRQRFFDALLQPFAALKEPLLLLLDDLHWADQETLDWLAYLTGDQAQLPLLLIGTVRMEELEEARPVQRFRDRLAAAGQLTEMRLQPLSKEASARLAESVAGRLLATEAAEQLYRETEGNPLFVVESARMAAGRGAAEERGILPPRVQAVIEARLNQLSPGAREVAGLAAAVNNRFTFELLARAGQYGEDRLVETLDELWHRRLIREVDEDAYDFTHGKIREVAYGGLSKPRRRLLHRDLAQALEAVHAADLSQVSGRIAHHYAEAAEWEKALAHYQAAADYSASLYAYAEAEALYGRALGIAARLPVTGNDLQELYARRGRMLEHAGRFDEAVGVYNELLERATERADDRMACLALARLASCYIEPTAIHDLQAAEPLIARGLALAREIGDPALEVDLLWSEMIRETHYGRTEAARRLGEQCLAIAREHDLERQLGYALHDLALNLGLAGAVEQGTGYAEEAQAIFRKSNNQPMLADSLNQKGLMQILHLEFDDALRCLAEARQISQHIGNRWNLAYALWLEGIIWSSRGRWGKALAAWRESREQGQQAGFVMSLTSVPAAEGALWRRLGDVGRAEALHRQARAASLEKAPFMTFVAEVELARDALAAGEVAEGEAWLRAARGRPALGVIGTSIFAASLAAGEFELAAATGAWPAAVEAIERALGEVGQRKLRLHEPGLQLALGLALLAADSSAAEAPLVAALAMTQRWQLKPLEAQAQAALGRLRDAQGRTTEAEPHRRQAADLANVLAASLEDEMQRRDFLNGPAARAIVDAAGSPAARPFSLYIP